MPMQLTLWKSIAISTAVVTLILLVILALDIHQQIISTLQWLDTQGMWAVLWFILIMAAVVVLVLPGVLFTTGAGFVFGVTTGTIAVVIGTTIGACLSFLVARYLFAERLQHYILANNQLNLISGTIDNQGFRIVLLSRLIPFFPGKLSNYLFGLTDIPLAHFGAASFLGLIPFSLHNVYLGSLAVDIATLGSRHSGWGPSHWAVYVLGFVMVVAAVLVLNRWAKNSLETREQKPRSR